MYNETESKYSLKHKFKVIHFSQYTNPALYIYIFRYRFRSKSITKPYYPVIKYKNMINLINLPLSQTRANML